MNDFVEDKTSTINVRVYVSSDVSISSDTGYFNKFWKARYITLKNFPKDGTLADAVNSINGALKDYPNSTFKLSSIRKRTVWRLADDYEDVIFTLPDITPIFDNTYETSGTLFNLQDLQPVFSNSYTPSENKFSLADVELVFNTPYFE